VAADLGNGTAQKRKVTLCPACGQPVHKDPVTGRFTRHPDSLPVVVPAPELAPLPKRRRLFGRKRT
jgi:hypothetical protein